MYPLPFLVLSSVNQWQLPLSVSVPFFILNKPTGEWVPDTAAPVLKVIFVPVPNDSIFDIDTVTSVLVISTY